jgi:capsular polysaccharide biosynthesis protein
VVLRDQGNPVVQASSMMLFSKLNQHGEQPWPIFWCKQNQARLAGQSLALRNKEGRLCEEAVYRTKACACLDSAYWHIPSSKPLRLRGKWTSVVSRWVPTISSTNYAHWMFDALPRLAVLPEFPPDTSIIVPQHLQPYQTSTLKLLGLASRIRPTSESDIIAEEFYFSATTAMVVCYDPYGVRFLRRQFLPHARQPRDTTGRIFIHRIGAFRNAANIAEVEAFFQRRGWTICDLAKMDFTEQIGLFASAKAVCGIHGAGFTNCLWCQPGTKVLELFCDKYLSGCYEWLCQVVGAEHYYQVFPSDPQFNAEVDLRKVEVLLDNIGL